MACLSTGSPRFREVRLEERTAAANECVPDRGHAASRRIGSSAPHWTILGSQDKLRQSAALPACLSTHQPNVNANDSTPESKNSISNCRSETGPDCRIHRYKRCSVNIQLP